MEFLTNRHRDLTVFALVLIVQILLLGYQVRGPQDVRLIRVWAVTVITPAARLLETTRRGVTSLVDNYILLVGVRQENLRLEEELDQLKLEARFLRAELATAERAAALSAFRARSPLRTVAAHIIGASTVADSRVVYVDRGTNSGVTSGMAVITPDGIVGRVRAAYSNASQATLITDPGFAAGVISQTHHVQGTLKGRGDNVCYVDHVQNEETLEEGEWFYTTGDDRVFPRGLPVGQVRSLSQGSEFQEVLVAPAGLAGGLEEVLVVIDAVHQPVPEALPNEPPSPVILAPPQTVGEADEGEESPDSPGVPTDADRVLEYYRRVGEAQGHDYGTGLPGSTPPDFNIDLDPQPAPRTPGVTGPAAPPTESGPVP